MVRNARHKPIAKVAFVRISSRRGLYTIQYLSEVWLSPNARDKPPSDPRGVLRIARKLYLKNSILRDSAMEQKRQAEEHKQRGREPRSERGSACHYNQNPGGVSRMADEGVGARGDNVLAAVRLDAND